MDTVGDVVTALLKFDQSLPIMKAKDEEGNGFTTVWCIQREAYLNSVGRNQYNLEILSRSDIADGEYGDDPDIGEVVVIW